MKKPGEQNLETPEEKLEAFNHIITPEEASVRVKKTVRELLFGKDHDIVMNFLKEMENRVLFEGRRTTISNQVLETYKAVLLDLSNNDNDETGK